MMHVKAYDQANDSLFKFAVIITISEGNYVFCKHKERQTWEVPGGHRERGETILETARRELYEETGALDYEISPVCAYSVKAVDHFEGEETFGMLFFATVYRFEAALHSEIEKIGLFHDLPKDWTYPEIQPKLLEFARERGFL